MLLEVVLDTKDDESSAHAVLLSLVDFGSEIHDLQSSQRAQRSGVLCVNLRFRCCIRCLFVFRLRLQVEIPSCRILPVKGVQSSVAENQNPHCRCVTLVVVVV